MVVHLSMSEPAPVGDRLQVDHPSDPAGAAGVQRKIPRLATLSLVINFLGREEGPKTPKREKVVLEPRECGLVAHQSKVNKAPTE